MIIHRLLRRKYDRLALTGIWAMIVYIGGAGLACVAQLLIAKLIHAGSYGVYSYVLAWISLISYSATLGFNVQVVRFASAYRAAEQWSLMRGAIRFSVRRALAASLIAVCAALLLLAWRQDHLEQEFTTSMMIGMLTVPLITLQLIGASVVRVFGGFIAAILPERVFRDGLLIVIVGLAALFNVAPMDARLVVFGLFLSSAAALGFVAWAAHSRWPQQIKSVTPTYLPSDWWRFALPIMVMMGLEILMTRTGVILLGWSGRIPEAGVFALAFSMSMLIQLPRVAVSTYFSPQASELHARADFNGLQGLFSRSTILCLAGSAMLAVPAWLLTGPLLGLFGEDFAAAIQVTQILVLGQLLAAAAGPQQSLLTMTGNERSTAVIMIAITVLNIAGSAVAIAYYGAVGAAVVASGTYVAWNLAMAIHIKRRLGLTPGLVSAITGIRWPLTHDPEKWIPVFRKDHAQTKR